MDLVRDRITLLDMIKQVSIAASQLCPVESVLLMTPIGNARSSARAGFEGATGFCGGECCYGTCSALADGASICCEPNPRAICAVHCAWPFAYGHPRACVQRWHGFVLPSAWLEECTACAASKALVTMSLLPHRAGAAPRCRHCLTPPT